MATIPSNLQQTLNRGKARLNLSLRRALLANSQGAMNTLAMAALNLYYVRYLTANGYSTPGIARGPYIASVPLKPNQAVTIGKDASGQDYIYGVDYETTLAGGGNPVPLPDPPSGKPYVTQDQLVTLRSSQYAIQPSLKVSVSGWKPIVNGIMYNYPGQSDYNLSSFVPGSGHVALLLALRSDYTTLEAFVSASAPLNEALTIADINVALAQASFGSTAFWCYDVPTGATQILDSMTLLDCRQLINTASEEAITIPLPVLQGGTGETYLAPGSFLIGNGINPVLTLPFPLSVLNGGTGETFLAPHGALVVNASGAQVVTVAPGASGNVLTSNGTDWTSAAAADIVAATQTTAATVANTTSESSLMGSVSGSMTYVAGALNIVGRTVRFKQWGTLSDLALTPGNITIKFKLGAVDIVSSGAVALTAGLTAAIWELDVLLTVRSTGGSGTVYAQGTFKIVSTLTYIVEPLNSISQPVTVDLTASNLADPRMTFSVASVSNTISSTSGTLETLN